MKHFGKAIQVLVLVMAILCGLLSPSALALNRASDTSIAETVKVPLASGGNLPIRHFLFPDANGQVLLDRIVEQYRPKQTLGYKSARDLMYGTIDNKNNRLTGVYTGYQITLDPRKSPRQDAYNKKINAEHVWPQSRGASGSAKSDLHNLFPTRLDVNSARGNVPFGEIPDTQTRRWYRKTQELNTIPTQFIDEYSETKSGQFEPREDHKGNTARAMFYFYTIYSDRAKSNFFEQQRDTLCQWHLADPADAAEIARSHAIARAQGNENPFVLDATLAGRTYCQSGTVPIARPDREGTGTSPESEAEIPSSSLTLIHEVQGRGEASPLMGRQDITIEGIVVGDFQDTNLNGFYVQEEDADADVGEDAELTSEGIFVYAPSGQNVKLGDKVLVTGTVDEFYNQTQLDEVSALAVEGKDLLKLVTPAELYLPFESDAILEHYEGMLVTLPQTLTVSDNHNLGRYGEIVLSNGRLFNPTNVTTPGAAAQELQARNDRDRIIIDDGSTEQNPDPIPYPTPTLSATNTLRDGDTVTGVTGVLAYSWSGAGGTNAYRLHPITTPKFASENPRPAKPEAVGGSLKVASFNVLNYFDANEAGKPYPTPRGADTSREFDRQRAKIVRAIATVDADIVGLMELENDGYGTDSAIQDLVNGLNAATAPGTYDFIAPGLERLGNDEITVGLIYRPQTVEPIGKAATIGTGAFADKNRQPLAQTFREQTTGETFTIAVNHFKSKGGSGTGLDADRGDGQGNWNATRTQAATELIDWLESDPTASNDPDVLIVGDLNAYAKEDPIAAIQDRGYSNLIQRFVGNDAYSFVFFGQAGYLDHALSSPSLTPQVTGVTEWHVNADEPRVLDYNEEFKSANQRRSLYEDNPYRSSDHDPVIIGLRLGA